MPKDYQISHTLLTLRIKWFKYVTREFIARNTTGLLVLVLFLPGVAIGDNFKLFMSAVTKPFVLISTNSTPFLHKLLTLLMLQIIFVVWARAQRAAINGGNFTQYLRSTPIDHSSNNIYNLCLLLLSNHLLWILLVASFYFLTLTFSLQSITLVMRNVYLILLLFSTQYVFVFKTQLKPVVNIIVLSFLFNLSVDNIFEIFRTILIYFLLFILIKSLLKPDGNVSSGKVKRHLLPRIFKQNYYFQMLFKSGFSSTLFRLALIIFLMVSYTLLANHFADISNKNLFPYAIVLEALLAYYVSGFFVFYTDEREPMSAIFRTLPIKKHFWPLRDICVTFLITTFMHAPLYYWQLSLFNLKILGFMYVYHIALILVCYPLRIYVKITQTFVSFVVLFIITAITLYNFP